MIRASLAVFAISLLSLVHAQDKDAHLWTGVGADLALSKKLSLDFESQVRFSNNVSMFRQAYGELGASYKIVKGLKAGFIYRYARKFNGDYYSNANRFTLYTSYRLKTDIGLALSTKLRYQHGFDRFGVVNGLYPNKSNLIRLGFKASYKIKGFKLISPFIGAEFFHAVQPQNPTSFIDTYRIKVGANFDLPKRLSLKAFYIFEHENRSVDEQIHIYGLQLNYSIKPFYKKKGGDKKPEGDAAP